MFGDFEDKIILFCGIWANRLEKMEIGKYFFGKKHGKLAHLKNLAPKIIYAIV